MTEDFTRPAGQPHHVGPDVGGVEQPPTGPPAPVGPPPPVTSPPPGAPAPVSTGAHDTAGSSHGEQGSDSKETAKQEAGKVAENAKEQAANVAGTARQEIGQTAGEAKRQAQDLLRQGQSEISSQAGEQQVRLASGLRSFSAEIGQMADSTEEPGIATAVARWASQVTDDAGQWLEDRDPSSVLDEVRRYARRSPGTFMLIAAGLGLAAGRVARSLKDSGDDDGTSVSPGAGHSTPSHATPSHAEPSPTYGTGPAAAAPVAPGMTYGTGSTTTAGDPGGLR